ncbi:hypothetical protein [Streptomyces flavovirens]|uniref:hypothetical protein n=1 Tax=Streptomyces flavovirens TaxID=52258 RepID=UPI0031EC50DB
MRSAKRTAATTRRAVRGTGRTAAPGAARAALREALAVAADALAERAAAVTTKRALDLGLGSALLLLASPALGLAALVLAVRRGGGGEGVVRREPRIGLGGRPFELRSLRTRRFRLDLLSRLPHVVRGELSLVGPPPPHPDDPALRDPLTAPLVAGTAPRSDRPGAGARPLPHALGRTRAPRRALRRASWDRS